MRGPHPRDWGLSHNEGTSCEGLSTLVREGLVMRGSWVGNVLGAVRLGGISLVSSPLSFISCRPEVQCPRARDPLQV